ncbi:peroxisomal membrane protein pex16-like [Plakobranchus ocellatus]|uniref:Peroxisomal membrane protein PEX16 n=1 Tax=Plakobranchus ocellatus TaxID=259542 RepID=A0AAV3YUJ6_9GAST|nr:peroxisomal membrane protein pex16-like [Plakobranchus ocellatus]
MFAFGPSSFKPWLVSSGLDIGSLCLLGDSKDLNPQEQAELRRRALMLAMYLLRSPFYDRYSNGDVIISRFGLKCSGLDLCLPVVRGVSGTVVSKIA